jgi:hypothetical protein
MPFTVVQSAFDGFFPRGQLQGYWKSLYLREFSDEAIDLTVHKTQKRPKGGSDFEFVYADFVPMGGAVNRVDPEETAFSERSAPWLVAVDANWTNSADNANNIAWVRQSVSELEQYGTGTTYLNFTGLKEEPLDTGVDEMLGRNLQRLAEVKKSYDPDNFFRRNNNIAPAAN